MITTPVGQHQGFARYAPTSVVCACHQQLARWQQFLRRHRVTDRSLPSGLRAPVAAAPSEQTPASPGL